MALSRNPFATDLVVLTSMLSAGLFIAAFFLFVKGDSGLTSVLGGLAILAALALFVVSARAARRARDAWLAEEGEAP